jgi:hypothetical protein
MVTGMTGYICPGMIAGDNHRHEASLPWRTMNVVSNVIVGKSQLFTPTKQKLSGLTYLTHLPKRETWPLQGWGDIAFN